jgi:hypothetical protein
MHIARRLPRRLAPLACALALTLPLSGAALAENSEDETPPDEHALKLAEPEIPEAVRMFVAYLQDLDARYPSSSDFDPASVIAQEGENIATLYCLAIGLDGPCAPDAEGNYVPVGGGNARIAGEWWLWLNNYVYSVGVIPELNACPSPYGYTFIHMDDENDNNNNSRSGWIGATASGRNTTWRHCRLPNEISQQFRPLPQTGSKYNYAVQNMGVFCPPGATRAWRIHDNQDAGFLTPNGNTSGGGVFPSFNLAPGNWFTFTCHFRGGNTSAGTMSAFPTLGMRYGVYASQHLPAPYALATGRVHQDDEDNLNTNQWVNLPAGSDMFLGITNTLRYLVRVK